MLNRSITDVLMKVPTLLGLLVAVYEKFSTGKAYSAKQIAQLIELKRIYKETLDLESPVVWELDTANQPTHHIKRGDWSLIIKQLQMRKNGIGHFYLQAGNIAEYAETYLTSRGERKSAAGKAGDLVEQFFGEWIDFALNVLPTYEFDEKTIKIIQKRIYYLEQVQKNEKLFKHGFYKRGKTKTDTIESIRNSLVNCLNLAEREIIKRCARDELNSCCKNIEALLSSLLQIIYYARKTKTHHEPLNLKAFLTSGFITQEAKSLYPKLKKTHTGALLDEILQRSGLEPFGESTPESIKWFAKPFVYYDQDFKSNTVKLNSKKFDFPAWCKQKVSIFTDLQELGGLILRVALLSNIVQQAYDLAGKSGDEWGYGNDEGKKHLSGLLYLLDAELEQIKIIFDKIYTYHDEQRRIYNNKKSVNPDTNVNRNFNKIDHHKEQIMVFSEKLRIGIKEICLKIANYPKDSTIELNEKKQRFYSDVTGYFKRFYPNKADTFHFSDKQKNNSHKNNSFDIKAILFPFKEHTNFKNYFYLDMPMFQDVIVKQPSHNKINIAWKNWQLGKNYKDWVEGFFTRYQEYFKKYQTTSESFAMSKTHKAIDDTSNILISIIHSLKQKINEEKPKWRFKLGLWPIKTKGWPFNRKAKYFTEQLLKVFDEKHTNILMIASIIKDTFKSSNNQIEPTCSNSTISMNNRLKCAASLVYQSLATVKDPSLQKKAAKRMGLSLTNEVVTQKVQKSLFYINLNKFCTKLNGLVSDWIADPSKHFSIFENAKVAKHALLQFISYRRQCSESDFSFFLDDIANIMSLLKLNIDDQHSNILSESKNQAKILYKFLQIISNPKEDMLYENILNEFNSYCLEIFSNQKTSTVITKFSLFDNLSVPAALQDRQLINLQQHTNHR